MRQTEYMEEQECEYRVMYEKSTRGINVAVEPDYLDDQSEPEDDHYVWAYTVRIDNKSSETVTLKSRHWRIQED